MEFNQFCVKVQRRAYKETQQQCVIIPSIKDGRALTALSIYPTGCETAAPLIYLDPYYEDFQNGTDFETVYRHIMDVYKNFKPIYHSFDMSYLKDYDIIKSHLEICFMNLDTIEKEKVSSLIFKEFGSLACVCEVIVITPNGAADVYITKAITSTWKKSVDEIFSQALKNTLEKQISKAEIPNADAYAAYHVHDLTLAKYNGYNGATILLNHNITNTFDEDMYIILLNKHNILFTSKAGCNDPVKLYDLMKTAHDIEHDTVSGMIFCFNAGEKSIFAYPENKKLTLL